MRWLILLTCVVGLWLILVDLFSASLAFSGWTLEVGLIHQFLHDLQIWTTVETTTMIIWTYQKQLKELRHYWLWSSKCRYNLLLRCTFLLSCNAKAKIDILSRTSRLLSQWGYLLFPQMVFGLVWQRNIKTG